MPKVIGFKTTDVRFPTSRGLDGSDAMNQDPDYSAAYLELKTDDPNLSGYGLVFTIGRGNDLQCAAIDLLATYAVGREVSDLAKSMGDFAKSLVRDSQMRWLGPEKGLTHMAAGAVINAAWDLVCKVSGKPLWKHLDRIWQSVRNFQEASLLPVLISRLGVHTPNNPLEFGGATPPSYWCKSILSVHQQKMRSR